METVLDVYHEAYDETRPLICMDEAARQLLSDVTDPLPMKPGKVKRVEDKYEREGTCSLFMFYNPIAGWRRVSCRDSRTAIDWAEEVRQLCEQDYPDAELITLVCDQLNTHKLSNLYKAFDAETACRLRRKVRLIHTPVRGSWLNMAEIELSHLSRQALGSTRFRTQSAMRDRIAAWQTKRNTARNGTNWQFTTGNAQHKLKALYPIPDIDR